MNHQAVRRWVVTREIKGELKVGAVEAHRLTLETAGALSFWYVDADGMNAWLMFAFNDWVAVEIAAPREPEPVRGPSETPIP